jgi:hypothetical protein
MTLNWKSTVRGAALAMGVGASSLLAAFPAAADETLTDAQCRNAKAATIRTLEEFTGKMSAPMAQSLGRFSATCDLKTKFDMVPGLDEKVWDTFRVRLNLIRTSRAQAPGALAQQ